MARKAADTAGTEPKKPAKRASKSTTPTVETLGALDAVTLVRLILDETARNAVFRKRVSAAIAGLRGPDAVAALIDRRLTALEKARGFIDWQKSKSFAADLEAMVATIVADLRPLDAGMALDRLLRFLGGAGHTFERVDDTAGRIQSLYERAVLAAAEIATALPPAQIGAVAEALVPMLDGDALGLLNGLLETIVPALPEDARTALDDRLIAALAEIPAPKPGAMVKADPWGVSPDFEIRINRQRLGRLRQVIADTRGDVDAFIAIEGEVSPQRPDNAAIAERLLGAGRLDEALDRVRRGQERRLAADTRERMLDERMDLDGADRRHQSIEIRILDALGRGEEAQSLRWSRFEQGLDPQALRDYLARLPDFEDEEALERALVHVETRTDPHASLLFLIGWPQLDRAAKLVVARRTEWRGHLWQWLAPAAEALEPDHPLAASLLYRTLLDDILDRARSRAYGHGARHLAALGDLAAQLKPGDLTPDHAAYVASLRKMHGRKSGFWDYVDGV